MKDPKDIYEYRVTQYNTRCQKLAGKLHAIENWRLAAALAGIACAIYAYWTDLLSLLWFSLLLFASLFVYLIIVHGRVKKTYEYTAALQQINYNSIERLEGRWVNFLDTGEEFRDEGHPYSHDLDLFGRESLFQWISTACTESGRKKIKELLAASGSQIELIKEKQEAIRELAKKRWWRQKYQAEAVQITEKAKDISKLITWIGHREPFYSNRAVVYVIRLLPLATSILLLLAYGLRIIPPIIPILAVFLQFCLYMFGLIRFSAPLKTIYTYQKAINVYKNMLAHFEKAHFTSTYIASIKQQIKNQQGRPAYQQLESLQKLIDRVSSRENGFFAPINIILLWDYQCMVDLEQWKIRSGQLTECWLDALGKMEALSSLALIHFDYPQWAFPEFTAEPSVFRAKSLAHPLLTNKQVPNDLAIEKPVSVLLITGSNMSGKSTLLRAAGVNLILAYAGAPVCAKRLQCSIMQVYSSMRINDNLEKGISGFYAELLRIKNILKAAKEKNQVFFLLDEIFKGTNSHDRHIGAKILITKLYKQNAVGLVSTHDLELGELEEESSGYIVNYNFQEYYKDGQIFFDYKLRPGLSTTRNALYLMRMIGIEA